MATKKRYTTIDDLHILNRVACDQPEYPMGNQYWQDLCATNASNTWQAFRERFAKKIFWKWKNYKQGLTEDSQLYLMAVEKKLEKRKKRKHKQVQHGKVKTTLMPRSCSEKKQDTPEERDEEKLVVPIKTEKTISEEENITEVKITKVASTVQKMEHSNEMYQKGSFDADYEEKPTEPSSKEEYLIRKICEKGIHYEMRSFETVEYINATTDKANCIFCN